VSANVFDEDFRGGALPDPRASAYWEMGFGTTTSLRWKNRNKKNENTALSVAGWVHRDRRRLDVRLR
jgi:hypothetical protein